MTRTMKQPRKDMLRDQLALAATEIIDLRARYIGWPQTRDRLIACACGLAVGVWIGWVV